MISVEDDTSWSLIHLNMDGARGSECGLLCRTFFRAKSDQIRRASLQTARLLTGDVPSASSLSTVMQT
jgi:hypothetical protein